ncbi:17091_t:CDS:2 [Gigaspora margarita]|uniref:17091_t:CDS:1 n=1 Tax=Gigaspora margarita TaxID=4874 RepID=A0ABN7UF28_GIGMA|nr:17091_t:CDS:2 [Gigaspora margarita]
MILPCLLYGKDDFKKTRDQKAHLKRKFKCKPKPILQNKFQEAINDGDVELKQFDI